MRKAVSILGSTGSIGTQTLEVIASFPTKFQVAAITANGNLELLEEQIKKFSPKIAVVADEASREKLISRLSKKTTTTIYFGQEGLIKAATLAEAKIIVIAIPGISALPAALAAINLGKTLALASKEILVAAGDLVMSEVKRCKVKVFPVDSEHSAIFQCLKGENPNRIKRIILTASGGPFLSTPLKALQNVTVKEALAHPTWKMGKKVTIDSATLMNKGFEVIEAHHLFDVSYSKIEVIIHPQSIIHSMVEFIDGSLIAQLSAPDMHLPIQYALFQGERLENAWPKLDLAEVSELSFQEADLERFPCLSLAYKAGEAGGKAGAILNAANEEAVKLFLEQKIKFSDIPKLIDSVLSKIEDFGQTSTLDEILTADNFSRTEAIKSLDNKIIK